MKLSENIIRVKELMGLISESTNKISDSIGNIVLVSDYVKNHIKTHNDFGLGSVFREGISDEEILEYVKQVVNENELKDGGFFEVEVPLIGYDLVRPYEEAINYPDADESVAIKKERELDIEVPLIKTSLYSDEFTTDILTMLISKSNPDFLPADVKNDEEIKNGIREGKVYSLITAFPGKNIPKASKWNGEYAVIVPRKKDLDFNMINQ